MLILHPWGNMTLSEIAHDLTHCHAPHVSFTSPAQLTSTPYHNHINCQQQQNYFRYHPHVSIDYKFKLSSSTPKNDKKHY